LQKVVLVICVIICMLASGAIYAQEKPQEGSTTISATEPQSSIPNYTDQEPDETNGRAVHLDTEKESAEDLNAVELKVIRRDTIISNRPAVPAN